jgi:hypothetical protein
MIHNHQWPTDNGENIFAMNSKTDNCMSSEPNEAHNFYTLLGISGTQFPIEKHSE